MNKLLIIFFLIVQILFSSCHNNNSEEIICYANFKKAAEVAYENPNKPAALDSALVIVNSCLKCDSLKVAAINLKISLLITLSKFKEGALFVDSLKTSDFTYPYKKKLNHDNFIALNFASANNFIERDSVFREMIIELKKHINTSNLKSKEFREAFFDFNTINKNLNSSEKLDLQIDSLKLKYPEESNFLDLFKH